MCVLYINKAVSIALYKIYINKMLAQKKTRKLIYILKPKWVWIL